ncbi:MAG: serine protease [Thermodesulfobacteriota bacterium]
MKRILVVTLVIWFGFGPRVGVWAEQGNEPQPQASSQQPNNPTGAPQQPRKEEAGKPQRDIELNTLLMQSTFMLVGQSKELGKVPFATGFIIGRPLKKKPEVFRFVLVTAAHVFEAFQGQKAVIILRKQKEDGAYEKVPFEFQILDVSNKPLWVRHPDKEVDVAAMYISLPSEVKFSLIPTQLLGDDAGLEKFEIHPGDELLCLGFPLGVQSPLGGFPILRSGKIASYPLIPAKKIKKFYFDFQIYDGNSGGPVYFIQAGRYYDGSHHLGETIHFIIGLVSAKMEATLYNNQPVYLAEIVPAQFILETVNLLPEQED